MKAVIRFLADWRNGAVFLASVLLALVLVIVVDGIRARDQAVAVSRDAIARNQASASAATRRIDQLQATIANMTATLQIDSATQATYKTDIAALDEQVRRSGNTPIVTIPSTNQGATTP